MKWHKKPNAEALTAKAAEFHLKLSIKFEAQEMELSEDVTPTSESVNSVTTSPPPLLT